MRWVLGKNTAHRPWYEMGFGQEDDTNSAKNFQDDNFLLDKIVFYLVKSIHYMVGSVYLFVKHLTKSTD